MKPNWGHYIIMVYIFFIGGMLVLALKSSHQKFDLVQSDYYNAELKYQKVIDATKRATALGEAIQVLNNGKTMTIKLPTAFKNEKSSCNIQLYCTSDAINDLKQVFTTISGEFQFPLLQNMKGNYTIKLFVESNEIEYYFEKKIVL